MLYSEPFTLYLFGFKYFRFPALSTPSARSSRGTSSWSAVPSKRSTGQQHSIDGVYSHKKKRQTLVNQLIDMGCQNDLILMIIILILKSIILIKILSRVCLGSQPKSGSLAPLDKPREESLLAWLHVLHPGLFAQRFFLARDLISLKPTSMRI